MSRKISILFFLTAACTLLMAPSCKTKYLEVQLKYERAKQKKMEVDAQNKELKKELVVLSDSLAALVSDYNDLKPYGEQIRVIESLKKQFLEKRVPYYLEMKKRQAPPVKSKKK